MFKPAEIYCDRCNREDRYATREVRYHIPERWDYRHVCESCKKDLMQEALIMDQEEAKADSAKAAGMNLR
jgi:hypothetical protein